MVQIGGNLLAFAAFGALAPARWRIGVPTVVTIAASASVAVETLRYVAGIGRVTSLDDVLLNAVGAGLAALSARPYRRTGTAARTGRAGIGVGGGAPSLDVNHDQS